MSNFTLSNDDVTLVDYVEGSSYLASLPISFDASTATIRSDLGMYNSSGVELDRTNLVIQFDGDDATTGIPSILRYRLTELPTFSTPVTSSITFYMTSGVDGERASNETQVALTLDVSVLTDGDGVTHVSAVGGEYKGIINSSSFNNLQVTLTFTSDDEIATAYLEDGSPVLDLKFFSFLSKLDTLSGFINFSLEGNYHFDMEVGGESPLPIQTWDGTTVSTLSSVMPISADSNQAPQWAALLDRSISEEGTVLLDLSAVDPEGQAVSFSVEGGSADTVAATIVDGKLQLVGSQDYSTTTPIELTLKAEDSFGAYNRESFLLSVTEVNDAPTGVALSGAVNALDENIDTTNRVQLAQIDVTDDALGANVLSLVAGEDTDYFEIDGSTLYLKANQVIDFEQQPQLSVTVQVIDSSVAGSNPLTVAYSLTINDQNEGPTALTATSTLSQLEENSTIGDRLKVADLSVTDDALGTNQLTLSGGDTGAFEIEGSVLYLRAGTTLDHEQKDLLSVTIAVADASLPESDPATVDVQLTVTDQNEAPVVTSADSGSIPDHAPGGTTIYTVSAEDPDQGEDFSFSLGGADVDYFLIDAQGNITLKAEADSAVKSSYSIEVTVSDGELSDTQAVDLSVMDQLDAYYWGDNSKLIPNVLNNNGVAEKSSETTDRDAISLTDVLLSLKHYLGKTELTAHGETAADYNGDQSVDLSDVLLILKSYLGKVEALPAWHFETTDDGAGNTELVGVLRGDADGSWEPPA